jgi:hypothetical protein
MGNNRMRLVVDRVMGGKRPVRAGLTTLAVAAVLGASAAADARPASIEGKWRLNPKETETLPGEEAPAELIMAITKDDGKVFNWTVTVRMPDGASGSTSFSGAIDGKPYPIAGRPGSTSAFSWLPDGTLKQVSEQAAGFVVEVCEFSGGMKKMECSARQTDKQGRVVTYVESFDRM